MPQVRVTWESQGAQIDAVLAGEIMAAGMFPLGAVPGRIAFDQVTDIDEGGLNYAKALLGRWMELHKHKRTMLGDETRQFLMRIASEIEPDASRSAGSTL